MTTYSKKFAYQREHTVYGVSVNPRTGQHYCFNRDYLVLPVQLPSETIEGIEQLPTSTVKDGLSGHGRLKPNIEPESECKTIFLFKDGHAPKWTKGSRDYDRSPYE